MNLLAAGHNTAAPGGNYPNLGGANFGLGGIGSLANFGGYLGSKGGNNINTSGTMIGAPNMSAYATNASDLIRGFKSSQSIPVVSS